jgi:hypothetical protein
MIEELQDAELGPVQAVPLNVTVGVGVDPLAGPGERNIELKSVFPDGIHPAAHDLSR